MIPLLDPKYDLSSCDMLPDMPVYLTPCPAHHCVLYNSYNCHVISASKDSKLSLAPKPVFLLAAAHYISDALGSQRVHPAQSSPPLHQGVPIRNVKTGDGKLVEGQYPNGR